MPRIQITLDGAAEFRNQLLQIQRKFKGSKRPVLEKIADRLADRIRRNLQQGNFLPISEATLRFRRWRGFDGTTPLIQSGKMAGSIRTYASDNVAAAGPTEFYSGFVQLGITTSDKSAIPNRKVPGRPFVSLAEQDISWAQERLLDYLLGEGEPIAA